MAMGTACSEAPNPWQRGVGGEVAAGGQEPGQLHLERGE